MFKILNFSLVVDILQSRKGVESGHFKMAKESGKGANSYKLGDTAKVKWKPEKSRNTFMMGWNYGSGGGALFLPAGLDSGGGGLILPFRGGFRESYSAILNARPI